MTSHAHDRTISLGFVLAYVGVLGLLPMMSSPNFGEGTERAIRLALAATALPGGAVLLIGKLIPARRSGI